MSDDTLNRTRDMAVDMERHRQALERDKLEREERFQRVLKMLREEDERLQRQQVENSIRFRLDLGR